MISQIGSMPGGNELLRKGFDAVLSAADLGIPGLGTASSILVGALFGSPESAIESKLKQLDRRLAASEETIEQLKKFSAFIAVRVNKTELDVKETWSHFSELEYRTLRNKLPGLRQASRPEQQNVVNDIAVQADQFLTEEFQTYEPKQRIGSRRWLLPVLKVSYKPGRPGLEFSSTTQFYPDLALEQYVKFVSLLVLAEDLTGLKANAQGFSRGKHIEFLTVSATGKSLPELMRPARYSVSFGSKYVDRNGQCEVTTVCTRYTRAEVVTPIAVRLVHPGESALCTVSPSSLESMARELLLAETSNPTVGDHNAKLMQAAAARLQGMRTWPPSPAPAGYFDFSTRNLEAHNLFAVSATGDLVHYEIRHYEKQRHCRKNAGSIAVSTCPLSLVAPAGRVDMWVPVHEVKEIRRGRGAWANVKSAAAIDFRRLGANTTDVVITLSDDGKSVRRTLSLEHPEPVADRCRLRSFARRSCASAITLAQTEPVLRSHDEPLAWPSYESLFSEGSGTIYAIDAAGSLYRIQDLPPGVGPSTRSKSLTSGSPATACVRNQLGIRSCPLAVQESSTVGVNRISEAWGAVRTASSSGSGAIVAIGVDGNLRWYRPKLNAGGALGSSSAPWEGPAIVASGWSQFRTMAINSAGGIYAIDRLGDLTYHQARDRKGEMPQWSEPVKLASGWGDFRTIFTRTRSSNPLGPR